MQSAKPELVCDEPEGPAEPTGPMGVEPMEMEEETQRVQPATHADMEVIPPEVTTVYK